MVRVIQMDDSCKGKTLTFRYQTEYYYDVVVQEKEWGLSCALERKPFGLKVEKAFTDTLLSDWLEEPRLFGAEEDGKILGYLELSHERWNNRMRIANIWVEERRRGRGIGSLMMERAVSEAQKAGARALVLETQSCNDPAIQFYRRHGFSWSGIDLTAYSQEDVQRKEVRLELARPCL